MIVRLLNKRTKLGNERDAFNDTLDYYVSFLRYPRCMEVSH